MALPKLVGPWLTLLAWVIVVAVGLAVLVRAARTPGWSRRHRTALACGALLTYVWSAPINTVALGVPVLIGVIGNVVFGLAAVAMVVLFMRQERRTSGA